MRNQPEIDDRFRPIAHSCEIGIPLSLAELEAITTRRVLRHKGKSMLRRMFYRDVKSQEKNTKKNRTIVDSSAARILEHPST